MIYPLSVPLWRRSFALPWVSIFVLVALLSGSFAGNLNGYIVNIAYPSLMQAYQVPFDLVVWIGIATPLGMAACLPIGGRLGDVYGYRRIYLVGTLLFLFACGLSAIDLGFWPTVVGRLLQGVGSAGLTPAILAIMARDFPRERRGELVGLWALSGGLGSALSPTLGGWLLTYVGLQAVFAAAMPVLVLSLLLGWRHIPVDPARGTQRLEDGLGAGLLVGSLFSAVIALQQVVTPIFPTALALSATVAVVLLGLFVVHERRVERPFVPHGIFRVPGFANITFIGHIQMVTMSGILALTPVYLISVHDLPAQTAGLVLLPMPLAMLGSAWFGRLSERVGARPLVAFGLGLTCLVSLMATLWSPQTPVVLLAVQLGLAGIGAALIQAPLVALATRIVPAVHLGMSSGLVNMARFLGAVVGPSLVGVIMVVAAPSRANSSITVSVAPGFVLVAIIAACGAVLAMRVPHYRTSVLREPVLDQSRSAATAPLVTQGRIR